MSPSKKGKAGERGKKRAPKTDDNEEADEWVPHEVLYLYKFIRLTN